MKRNQFSEDTKYLLHPRWHYAWVYLHISKTTRGHKTPQVLKCFCWNEVFSRWGINEVCACASIRISANAETPGANTQYILSDSQWHCPCSSLCWQKQLDVNRVFDLLQSCPVSEFLYAVTNMTLSAPAQGMHWDHLDFLVLVTAQPLLR